MHARVSPIDHGFCPVPVVASRGEAPKGLTSEKLLVELVGCPWDWKAVGSPVAQKSMTASYDFLGWWVVSNKNVKSVRPELNSDSQVLSSAIPPKVTLPITSRCLRNMVKNPR